MNTAGIIIFAALSWAVPSMAALAPANLPDAATLTQQATAANGPARGRYRIPFVVVSVLPYQPGGQCFIKVASPDVTYTATADISSGSCQRLPTAGAVLWGRIFSPWGGHQVLFLVSTGKAVKEKADYYMVRGADLRAASQP